MCRLIVHKTRASKKHKVPILVSAPHPPHHIHTHQQQVPSGVPQNCPRTVKLLFFGVLCVFGVVGFILLGPLSCGSLLLIQHLYGMRGKYRSNAVLLCGYLVHLTFLLVSTVIAVRLRDQPVFGWVLPYAAVNSLLSILVPAFLKDTARDWQDKLGFNLLFGNVDMIVCVVGWNATMGALNKACIAPEVCVEAPAVSAQELSRRVAHAQADDLLNY